MAESKQVPLNGAYHGPPIPPQHDNHKRSGTCCSGPCRILSTLIKIFVTVVIVLAIAGLVLWLVYRPSKMRVYVSRASLTRFNLTNGNNLHYNLTVDLSVRNRNKRIGIYYDRLEARAYYDGERFDSVPLPTFYQGHKNITKLSAVFEGQNFIALDSSGVKGFNQEKSTGFFYVDVKIYARIRFKIGSLKTNRYKPKFYCELSLPLATNGSSLMWLGGTKCDVDF